MKKVVASILTMALVSGTASYAVDAMKLSSAVMGLAGSLAKNIPSIIEDIRKFPEQAKANAEALRDGIRDLSTYLKSAEFAALPDTEKQAQKQKRLDDLFIKGVDLSILVTNLMYKVMKIVKHVGPVILAVDEDKGKQANEALQLAVQIMKMVNTTNKAMRKQVVDKLPAEKKAGVPAVAQEENAPALDFI
jgi:hypothetical protein